jgi:hypothetical protein
MVQNNYIFGKKYGSALLANLVAYYAFESNANDSHGGKNGTLFGTPTFTTGINGNAINFGNNTNLNSLTVADNDDFSFTNGTNDLPFSFSCWVNFTAFSTTANFIVNKRGGSSGSDEWQFTYSPATERLSFVKFSLINTSNQQVRSDFKPNLNQWYHIVITDSGTGNVADMRMYIDNVLQTTKLNTTYVRMPNATSLVRMGLANFNLIEALKHRGLLDELAIWKNRELNATEVAELYNAGAGKFYPF